MQIFRLLLALVILSAPTAWAQTVPVGTVQTVRGEAFVTTANARVRAAPGVAVYAGSQLTTSTQASLGVVFSDATVMSFGPDTTLTVDEYLFGSGKGINKLSTKLVKGSLNYLSGAIAKLQPDAVRIQTRTGTLGIRGTHLLVLDTGLRAMVTLIADPDGMVGRVLVQGSMGSQVIDQANFSAPLDGSAPPSPTDASAIQQDFGDALRARPAQPTLPTVSPGVAGQAAAGAGGTPVGVGAQAGVAAASGGLSVGALAMGALAATVVLDAVKGSTGTTGTQ